MNEQVRLSKEWPQPAGHWCRNGQTIRALGCSLASLDRIFTSLQGRAEFARPVSDEEEHFAGVGFSTASRSAPSWMPASNRTNQALEDRLLDRSGVGERWDCSVATVIRLEQQGVLKPLKIGSKVKFRLSDIIRAEQEAELSV